MNGREGGTFSRDITKAKNGRWTFYDTQAKLNVGDILYYWTYVDYFDGERKLGYARDDEEFVVKELLPKPGASTTSTTSTTTTPRPTPETRFPDNECQNSVTTVGNKNQCKGNLIFSSDFSNLKQIRNKWNVQRKFATEPDYEFVIYEDNPQTLSVQNNHLIVSPILTESVYGFLDELDLGEKCTGLRGTSECYQRAIGWAIIPPVISAQLTTKGKFSFKYGRIEIKAKLPKGNWLYPELYLNSESEKYGPGYQSGQMRVAFLAGNDGANTKLKGGVILGQTYQARNYAMKTYEASEPWTNDFHNFTVLWKPESITLSVDNTVYGTIFPPEGGFSSWAARSRLSYSELWKKGTELAPFDTEMYLVVGVGAGGHNFEDGQLNSKPWINNQPKSQKDFYYARNSWFPTWGRNAQLEVDSINIWALD
ncbi:hypothetical protein ABEB36_012344 [Hypothenemus hampei]